MSFDTVEYANKLLARNSELCSRVKELEAAARDLLQYAKENQPHWECDSWLGEHPIDVMEKLLK